MPINGTSSVQWTVDTTAALTPSTSAAVMTGLSSTIEAVGIDSTTLRSFIDTAGMLKNGGLALTNAYGSVSSFKQWMQGGPPLSGNALATMAHGLNAMAVLDQVAGNTAGLANYTDMAGGLVNASKMIAGLQKGDMAQVLFSGAKLCATLAQIGSPIAAVTISIAEQAYNLYGR